MGFFLPFAAGLASILTANSIMGTGSQNSTPLPNNNHNFFGDGDIQVADHMENCKFENCTFGSTEEGHKAVNAPDNTISDHSSSANRQDFEDDVDADYVEGSKNKHDKRQKNKGGVPTHIEVFKSFEDLCEHPEHAFPKGFQKQGDEELSKEEIDDQIEDLAMALHVLQGYRESM